MSGGIGVMTPGLMSCEDASQRSGSGRFSNHNVIVVNKELSRTLPGAADHWQQTGDLFARD
jgi:hypothetical protein